MSQGLPAKNTVLNWNSQPILEIRSIQGPTESADMIDVTNLDSEDDYREFYAGLRDGGEISFEMNFVPSDSTGQIAFHTDFQAGTKRAFSLVAPGSVATIAGYGIPSKWEPSFPSDDKISINAAFKITGKPTLTIA